LSRAQKLFHISFNNDDDGTFIVQADNNTYTFQTRNGAYIYRHHDEKSSSLLSKRQSNRIDEAIQLQARLGYPGVTELYNTIKTGGINNVSITPTEILRLRENPNIPTILGKMTRPPPTSAPPEDWLTTPPAKPGTLSIDVMTIMGMTFLVDLIEEITYTVAKHLSSKTIEAVQSVLDIFLIDAKKHGWILSLRSDGEGSLKAVIEKL